MKNIHILPTDKPSRVQLKMNDTLHIENGECIALRSYQNIYITSFEEIKEGDWVYENNLNKETKIYQIKKIEGKLLFFRFKNVPIWLNKGNHSCKKIILTTDQDLIKDGVQAIDDEFLQWFVKNPTCEVVEVVEGVRLEDEWIDNEDGGEIFQHQYCCYEIIIPKKETKLDHIGVHLDHCYQGEYEDSCKYGDDDCPVNKIKQRAKNYMSLKDALEPKDVK